MLDLTRSLDAAAPAPLYQQLYDSLSAQYHSVSSNILYKEEL